MKDEDKSKEQLIRELKIMRKEIEKINSRESEKKYRDLVENLNEVIYATDKNAVVTYISPNVESFSGYSQSASRV